MLYWDSVRITKAFSVLIDIVQKPTSLIKKKYTTQVYRDFIAIMFWVQGLVTAPFLYRELGLEGAIVSVVFMYFVAVPLSYVSLWLSSYFMYFLGKLCRVDKKREAYYPAVSLPNIILVIPMQGVLAAAGVLVYAIEWYILNGRLKLPWYASMVIILLPALLSILFIL